VGAHDVVGGGDVGSDSSNGSWSSEIGGGTLLMPGTAVPATVPVPRGVDDANDAPMAVGGGRGGGERGAKTATAEQPPIGRGGWRQRGDHCRGDNRCLNDYDDYTNQGAGKDDAPLEDGRRKRIRRMGNKCCKVTLFSLSLF
jgi:hypothetical protein